jgi:hypothetical protein
MVGATSWDGKELNIDHSVRPSRLPPSLILLMMLITLNYHDIYFCAQSHRITGILYFFLLGSSCMTKVRYEG